MLRECLKGAGRDPDQGKDQIVAVDCNQLI